MYDAARRRGNFVVDLFGFTPCVCTVSTAYLAKLALCTMSSRYLVKTESVECLIIKELIIGLSSSRIFCQDPSMYPVTAESYCRSAATYPTPPGPLDIYSRFRKKDVMSGWCLVSNWCLVRARCMYLTHRRRDDGFLRSILLRGRSQ
jgi:hypothetical protein